ncbi:MAG: hypothetical protein KDH97_22680, partial [Calditrichaeota bacterium]|nr:hypothetical protein [Calditrichota bacterium]
HFYAEPKKVREVLSPDEMEKVTATTSATRGVWARGEAIPITVEEENLDDFFTTRWMFQDFAECVRSGGTPRSNVDNGREVAIAVDMALRALHNGTIEEWKPAYKG